MSELDDPYEELWIALAQPESLERVVESTEQLKLAQKQGDSQGEKVGDLFAQRSQL